MMAVFRTENYSKIEIGRGVHGPLLLRSVRLLWSSLAGQDLVNVPVLKQRRNMAKL